MGIAVIEGKNLDDPFDTTVMINEDLVEKLLKGAEHCCIVYQTIKKGIPVDIKTTVIPSGEGRKAA